MTFKQLQTRAGLNDRQLGMLLPNCTYKVINGYQSGAAVPRSVTDLIRAFISSKK